MAEVCLKGGSVPDGLHEAGGGVGVGAEEEMADFVGDDEAEHFAGARLRVHAMGGEIVVINVCVDAGAGFVKEGLAEDIGVDGAAAREDADGKLTRPGEGGAGRGGRRKVGWVRMAAVDPIEFDSRLSEDERGPGGGNGECVGGNGGIVENGESDAGEDGMWRTGGGAATEEQYEKQRRGCDTRASKHDGPPETRKKRRASRLRLARVMGYLKAREVSGERNGCNLLSGSGSEG